MAQGDTTIEKQTAEIAKKNTAPVDEGAVFIEDLAKNPLAAKEGTASVSGNTHPTPVQHSPLKVAPHTPGASAEIQASRIGRDAAGFASGARIKNEAIELSQPNSLHKENAEASAPNPPNPKWTVTRLDNDRLAIKVVRTVLNAEIALLLRSDSGVRLIAPKRQSNNDFYYEINVTSDDKLDLYQLNYKTSDYLKLPESGPMDGQRVRIFGQL